MLSFRAFCRGEIMTGISNTLRDYGNQAANAIRYYTVYSPSAMITMQQIGLNFKETESSAKDFYKAYDKAFSRATREFPNPTSNDLNAINEKYVQAMTKLSSFKVSFKDMVKQRNIFAIVCAPIFAAAIALAVLAFVFANPLAYIISGAILLAAGTSLAITSLARHVQYQSALNTLAKVSAYKTLMYNNSL